MRAFYLRLKLGKARRPCFLPNVPSAANRGTGAIDRRPSAREPRPALLVYPEIDPAI